MLALARAGLRTRLLLLAVIVLGCAVMRAGHFVATGGGPWIGTDAHSGATIIVLGLAIPTFVILLGAMLLRGEHAPWSWLLARPTGRTRLLAVAVVLDALTIAACVGAMALVFGGVGYVSHAVVEREIAYAVLPPLYVLLYLATAIGGARGLGSLRAGLLGVLWLGAVLVLGRLVLFAWVLLHELFGTASNAPLFMRNAGEDWAGIDRVVPYALLAIAVMAAMVVLVGVLLPFVRAAASVPALPRWRALTLPPIVAFVACGGTALGIAAVTSASLADADEIGDTEVVVDVRWIEGAEPTTNSITLNVPGAAIWQERFGTPAAGGSRWVFADVPAGTWRLCARFRRVADPARTRIHHEFECAPIDVPPDGSISVDLDLDRLLGARR